mgnify:CR=1 FL=1
MCHRRPKTGNSRSFSSDFVRHFWERFSIRAYFSLKKWFLRPKTKKDGISRQEFDALDKRVQRIEKQREQLRKTVMVILVEAAAAAASAIVVKLIAALIG